MGQVDDSKAAPSAEDLELVDDSLEDAGKTDDELWDELEQAETSDGTGKPPPDGDDKPSGDDDAATDAKADDETADDSDETGDDGKPGNAPADDGAAGDDAQGAQDDDTVDWEQADPKHRAAFEAAQTEIAKLRNDERTHAGRLRSLQLQFNELRRSRQSSAADEAAVGDGDDGQKGKGDGKSFLESQKWKDFSSEYPEVAGPLGEIITELRGTVDRQGKELAAIGSDRREDALAEQEALLDEAHAGWRDVAAEDGFTDWLGTQPRHIREAALRNADNIVDAEEAGDVIARYKGFRAQQSNGSASNNADAGTGQQQAAGDGSGKQPLSSKRQRQLASSASARGKGPGVSPTGIPEDGDPQEIWDAFEREEQRQAANAR